MVDEEVLRAVADPALRVHLVWVPMIGTDDEAAARLAASRIRDPRVRHYLDRDLAFAEALGRALALPPSDAEIVRGRAVGRAWDVYLLYPAGTTWPADARGDANEPPRPALWMHQLSHLDEARAPELDGPVLRARIEAALKARR